MQSEIKNDEINEENWTYIWVEKESPCDGNSLFLTPRQFDSSLPNIRFVTFFERLNELVSIGLQWNDIDELFT